MNVLIVYAHHEESSFNAALKDVAIDTLKKLGHTVTVSDLYAEEFQPVGDERDFTHQLKKDSFHYRKEQQHAYKNNTFAADIIREQQRVIKSGVIIFQCPMWCFSVPAIVKGWFDRVLTKDFAYGKDMEYKTGGLNQKTALLVMTTGGPERIYKKNGKHGSMNRILYPITRGMLAYCGFKVLDPFIAYEVENISAQERQQYLTRYAKKLKRLFPAGF